MLGAVLLHHLGELVVHVVLNADGRLFLLRGLLADDLGLDRTCGREGLHDRFGLELDRALHQQRVIHTACTGPRLCALVIFEAQQLQALDVGVKPVLARGDIRVVVSQQVGGQTLQV